jgi:hypothetical protein
MAADDPGTNDYDSPGHGGDAPGEGTTDPGDDGGDDGEGGYCDYSGDDATADNPRSHQDTVATVSKLAQNAF